MSERREWAPKWLIGVCVCLGCVGLWFFGGFAHVFWSAHLAAERSHCSSNVKHLALAVLMYASENNDAFPDAHMWTDRIGGYVEDVASIRELRCPAIEGNDSVGLGYAMNVALSQKKTDSLKEPAAIPLVFESVLLRWNAASGLETLPKPGRHYGTNTVAYADGHVRWVQDQAGS